MKAEACEIRAEARLWTSHTEVGRHCEPKAAADGGAMYGRYNRFFGAEEPVAFDIERGDAWPGLAAAAALCVKLQTIGENGPSAGGYALRCQHADTHDAGFCE